MISKPSRTIEHSLNSNYPEIKDQWAISLYFSGHDTAVAVSKGKQVLEVVELERFTNVKNFPISLRPNRDGGIIPTENYALILNEISNYVSRRYTSLFDIGVLVDHDFYEDGRFGSTKQIKFTSFFNAKQWFNVTHHVAHGAGAFHQSEYEKALVVTHDGGSPDGSFNSFLCNKNRMEFIGRYNTVLSKEYYRFGRLLRDIKYTPHNESSVYPGKIMGLAGYGVVDEQMLPAYRGLFDPLDANKFEPFYKEGTFTEDQMTRFLHRDERVRNKANSTLSIEEIKQLQIKDYKGRNIAATLQRAFELEFMSYVEPLLEMYPDLPVCLSGGASLNILANTLLSNLGREVFVPPDPSDCGLALGGLLHVTKARVTTPYLGPELHDLNLMLTYLTEDVDLTQKSNFNVYYDVDKDISLLAKFIGQGKIIGIARGRSEIGPRALGNRSIVCSVAIPDMKEVINSKVKNREWFRPFSPVVRREEVNKYFHWNKDSRFMSFCPMVRDEYKEKIKPVVHVDGTARVQTVTLEQNEFLYNLLTAVETTTGYGMLLNTSFNVDGKPIISSIKDAIKVLKNTRLDGIVVDNILIVKK